MITHKQFPNHKVYEMEIGGRPFTVEEQRQLVDLCAKGIKQLQSVQRSGLEG